MRNIDSRLLQGMAAHKNLHKSIRVWKSLSFAFGKLSNLCCDSIVVTESVVIFLYKLIITLFAYKKCDFFEKSKTNGNENKPNTGAHAASKQSFSDTIVLHS